MDRVLVRIETEVPITIFELPKVKEKVNPLFKKMESKIRARFDEIKAFITRSERKKQRYEEISYDEVSKIFKIYFYKLILNEVVKNTFSNSYKFDVVDNILELLTEEKLKDAILGETMIYAFKRVIGEIPNNDMFDATLDGSTMRLLEKEFLGREIPC